MEPNASGHHGPYLAWMSRGLIERGFDVTIITLPETAKHPSLQDLHGTTSNDGGTSIRLIGEPLMINLTSGSGTTGGLMAKNFAYWRLFQAWHRKHMVNVQPDVVFLPYLDYCLYAIGLLGSPFGNYPWVGLTMRPSFHYRTMNVKAPQPKLAGIKKVLFLRILRNRYLRKLLTIDEPLANYLSSREQFAAKATLFPEPADLGKLPEASKAKYKFGIATTRKVLLLYGVITVRKGVVEILRALSESDFPPTVDVLLAGKIARPFVQKTLDENWVRDLCNQGRLKIIDRFIGPAEEAALFAAADIVWLGYRGHYNSSGLLIQAASVGRPVLACEDGVIGWQTRQHNLGQVVNPKNTAAVITAIKTLLEETSGKKNNNERLNAWHPPSFSKAQDMLSHVLRGE
ncbi:MAG: hypothetical protein J7L86_01665 [Candidatus Marinimicrobia bacterium]|nr:hypothetical protein [Candidatus Neomarinimicrobiota bacterium]